MVTRRNSHLPRITPVMREGERVTPLELFFDLVFVLALTQCTALMAADPTWAGVAKGMAVLTVLWWAWVAYSWLTSVVDPEEGLVRIVMFVAMAAFLVAALCVPDAFGDLALELAIAYGVVRAAQIALFVLASRDEREFRRSVTGLGIGTALGVGLLIGASFADGRAQGALWILAIVLDLGEPFLFGANGWKLVPGHFAERHGLIVIIALGESIVAIGVGAEAGVDGGVITAAVLGIGIAAAMWWAYFDVVAILATQRLIAAPVGRVQNELARDAYSYLHLPIVAGIVLVALGLKNTLAHVGDPLESVPAFALLGGLAIYLLANVAFKARTVGSPSIQRIVVALLLFAAIPIAHEVAALATLAIAAGLMCALIAYESNRFAEARDHIRHHLDEPEDG